RGVVVALVRKGDPPRASTWRATSGAGGVARIDDVDLEYSLARSAWKAPTSQPFEVGVTIPLPEPVTVPVDLDALPAEPIELRLPATGSLAFQVVDGGGEPLAATGIVKVAWSKAGDLDVPLDEQGCGAIARVGLGLAGQALPVIPERGATDPVKFA